MQRKNNYDVLFFILFVIQRNIIILLFILISANIILYTTELFF